MKKFYLTTSIPYINAPPHIGFALELVQADVIARWHRSKGDDVFFLTGTDEHGAKVAKAARMENKDPEDFAGELSLKFQNLAKLVNTSCDNFIRTTDKAKHWPAVKAVWEGLVRAGDLYKKKYAGLYCLGCEAFILEKDLVGGRCSYHQLVPEKVEEENYFFKLSRYSDQIKQLIKKDKIKILPESRKNEIVSFFQNGLEDVSFSRSRERYWGWQVPGDPTQSIYVWVDALPNYLSGIGYPLNQKQFNHYWPADIHCIGKDILKFHVAIWPAILLSLGLPLPRMVFVHGFITSVGQKMSKSLGNVIDPFPLIEKYGADALRYYLLREITPTEDGDFTEEKFRGRYQSDLASGLGNLVARVRSLGEKVGIGKPSKLIDAKKIIAEVRNEYTKAVREYSFNRALQKVWELVSFCDKEINRTAPWKKQAEAPGIIGKLLSIIGEISDLVNPFLPDTSERIKREIGLDTDRTFLKASQGPLFPRID